MLLLSENFIYAPVRSHEFACLYIFLLCVCVSCLVFETPCRSLCLWNFPGKKSRVGRLCLLQVIFLTQRSNPGLLHCRQIFFTSWATRKTPSSYITYNPCYIVLTWPLVLAKFCLTLYWLVYLYYQNVKFRSQVLFGYIYIYILINHILLKE